jgi:hypothetical protein
MSTGRQLICPSAICTSADCPRGLPGRQRVFVARMERSAIRETQARIRVSLRYTRATICQVILSQVIPVARLRGKAARNALQ